MRASATETPRSRPAGLGLRRGEPRQWRGTLLYALAGVCLLSAVFYYRQNYAGQTGGAMSVEKILWLNYALMAWFVLPGFLARHPALDRTLRVILMGFLASMLGRGLIELWMLYVTLGWDPVYGISHDLFTILLILTLRIRAGRLRSGPLDGFNRDAGRFCTTLQLGLVAEIVFAGLFRGMAVHQHAIYFAAPTPEFRHINLLTRWVDAAAYLDLARLLWRQRAFLFWVRAAQP